jgi:peptidyl-prolyl cis-trans isomerase C
MKSTCNRSYFHPLACALAACGDDRLATVNGAAITPAEFDAYLKYKNLPSDNDRQKRAALEQYAEREALADRIEEQGLLDQQAIAVELNEFRKELLLSRYFEQFLRDKVSDQAVQNYYNANPQQFEEERAHVAHILLRTRRDMDDSERQVKLTTAREVYAKLTAGGDFAALASEYSEDTVSAKSGGDLGWLKRGAISQVFSDKIFGMDAGALAEPFESPFGYHIVKALEKPQSIRQPFESVKGDIRYQLRSQTKDAEVKRLLESARIEIK